MSLFWRPYLPVLIVLNSIYILYPYIGKAPKLFLTDFAASHEGAYISSHSETHDPKTKILYVSIIPLLYLPPIEPIVLLQRPINELSINDCWLMAGSQGYVEIKLQKEVKIHHFDYHHFNQTDISNSTPRIISVEAITKNSTMHLGTFNNFASNHTQRVAHKNHIVTSHLRLHVLQNYGNPIYTALCRFQIFGEKEEEKISIN